MKCPHCESEINDNSKFCAICHKPIIANIKRIRVKRSVSALFFSALAIATIAIPIISLFMTLIAAFFIIISYKENPKLSKITIIITVIAGTLVILNFINKFYDLEHKDNVLVGTWGTLPDGGYYILKGDNTYTEYLESDGENNFCTGTYSYEYGYNIPGTNERFIETDPDYTYYTVTLEPEKCIINGEKENNVDQLNVSRNLLMMMSVDDDPSLIYNITTKVYNEVKHEK